MLGPFGFQPKGCFASFFEDETECILNYSPRCGSGYSGTIIPAFTGSSLSCDSPASATSESRFASSRPSVLV